MAEASTPEAGLRGAEAAPASKYDEQLLVRCDPNRAGRIAAILSDLGLGVIVTSVPRKNPKNGWVLVGCPAGGPGLAAVRGHAGLVRCVQGLYPIRHVAASYDEVVGAVIAAVDTGAKLRLHAFDCVDNPLVLSELSLLDEFGLTLVKHGAIMSPTEFSAVVVVVRTTVSTLGWAIISPADFAALKNGAAATSASALCRAQHKLVDALQFLEDRQIPVNTELPALDVGAAPGGWTEALLTWGFSKVMSVDPAAMDAALLAKHPTRIIHFQKSAENAKALLRDAVDGPGYGALVCDVNAKASMIARTMLLPLAELLAPGAPLVLTLKLMKRATPAAAEASARAAEEALAGLFERFELVHLLGNTPQERTLIAFRSQLVVAASALSVPKQRKDGIEWKAFDVETAWNAQCTRLIEWVAGAGRLPLANARDRDERQLGKWVTKQRKLRIAPRGGWGPKHAQALEAISGWTWNSPEEDFDEGLAQLDSWISKHDGLPSTYATKGIEGRLAALVASLRRSAQKNRLAPKHRAALDARPWWTWTSGNAHAGGTGVDSVLGPRLRCKCGKGFNDLSQMELNRRSKRPCCASPTVFAPPSTP